jgi:hypothetical protein
MNLRTKTGEPSWDGIHPKLKRFAGYLFGYHKEEEKCLCCGNFTHYALHRKYKWTSDLEKAERDRPWCCSEGCFKKLVFNHTFDVVVPFEEAEKIIFNGQNV